MIASDGALTADTRGIIADPLTADHRGSATGYQEPTSKDPSVQITIYWRVSGVAIPYFVVAKVWRK